MKSILPGLDNIFGLASAGSGGVIFGLLIAAAVGIVILGGVKSIAKVAEFLVPMMCGVYVLSGVLILLMNITQVPASFAIIVGEALTGNAAYGGFVGQLVTGVQ